MMNGILRIQTYRPRQSAPVEGVTVVITGSGFTAHRITDAGGNAEDVAICAPACALSLDENNTTTLPYAVCSLTARKPGYRTVRIQGIQIFAGQVTLARPEMIPDTEEGKDIVDPPVIDPHPRSVCGERRQRPGSHQSMHRQPGAGPCHRTQKYYGPSGQARRLGPERDGVFPGLYRQCGFQRGLPHMAH